MPTGAQLFARTCRELGICEVFTLVGDHLNEVLVALHHAGVRLIDMRHESSVTHAADAWARIHRKPALALVTGGPGHTNSLTGIGTANLACSPLIAVSGAPSTLLSGRQVFQVIDQVSMAQAATKWSAQAMHPAQIPYLLGRAYRIANEGRKGAVHLTIPVNLFAGMAESPLPVPDQRASRTAAPSQTDVAAIEELLLAAERPLVVAGSGVWWADAGEALERFLERTGLPLFTVTFARGIVSDEHPQVFGYGDPAINRACVPAFQEADAILVLGKRIDYRLALGGPRLFARDAKVAQVDLVESELGAARKLDLPVCADVRLTLEALTARSGRWPSRDVWLARLAAWRSEFQAELARWSDDRSLPLHPAAVYSVLRSVLPPSVLYSWDGGDFVHWGRAMLPALHAGGWLRLGPMGTIGAALPNAIALQMAHPGRPVVLITGDGSLGFYLAELETLVRCKLPVVVLVGNDGGWGLERELQRELTGGVTVACELQNTRYDRIMEGFGGGGELVEEREQLAPALQRAFASGKPYLVNVAVRGTRSPFTEWQIAGKK